MHVCLTLTRCVRLCSHWLQKYIEKIRHDYFQNLGNKNKATRQLGTAMYLIDKLALRVGNEKDTSEEADTVGCCSLRVEHLTLTPPRRVGFDFLGKDSMRYLNEVDVDERVFDRLREFVAGKAKTDDVFDEISTSLLNQHLGQLMAGLTAKVFRTYNASITLQAELFGEDEVDTSELVAKKVLYYNKANREVAILCNHQRSVPKGHGAQMDKLDQRLKAVEDENAALKDHLASLTGKKRKGAAKSEESEELAAKRAKWSNDPKAIQAKLEKAEVRLQNLVAQKQTKDNSKTVALGTSKINYMDPRITVAWCKATETPIEKVFNKSLLSKFPWAMETKSSWRF